MSARLTPLSEIFVPSPPSDKTYSVRLSDRGFSFQGMAEKFELGEYSLSQPKRLAVTTLLETAFGHNRYAFCSMVAEIVKRSVYMRSGSARPITQDDVRLINRNVSRLGLKVPELCDPSFLQKLPSGAKQDPQTVSLSFRRPDIGVSLREELMKLAKFDPEQRGPAFEGFLNKLLSGSGLKPKTHMLIQGDKVIGQAECDGNIYYVSARWKSPATRADLDELEEKLRDRTIWSRVIFLSYAGFSPEAMEWMDKKNHNNLIAVDGQDLFLILESGMQLEKMIRAKASCAEREGRPFVSVQELLVTSSS